MPNKDPRNTWTRLSRRVAYENPWIVVQEDQVLTPAGTPGLYGVVQPRNLAVGVVPVDAEGNTWLVGQWRYPLDRYSWEICEGAASKAVDPQAEAARELAEETGLRATGWAELLRLDLSNSISDEESVVFLAWDLTQGEAAPDDTEDLQLRKVALEDAFRMVHAGEITDAISVAALLRVEAMALRGTLPAGFPALPRALTR